MSLANSFAGAVNEQRATEMRKIMRTIRIADSKPDSSKPDSSVTKLDLSQVAEQSDVESAGRWHSAEMPERSVDLGNIVSGSRIRSPAAHPDQIYHSVVEREKNALALQSKALVEEVAAGGAPGPAPSPATGRLTKGQGVEKGAGGSNAQVGSDDSDDELPIGHNRRKRKRQSKPQPPAAEPAQQPPSKDKARQNKKQMQQDARGVSTTAEKVPQQPSTLSQRAGSFEAKCGRTFKTEAQLKKHMATNVQVGSEVKTCV